MLATEMYKILNGLSPDIMQDMPQNSPQEILKQVDMDYKPSLTWFQKFGALYLKR